MARPEFPDKSTIVASTTDEFTVGHNIVLEQIQQGCPDFRVKLGPEGQEQERYQAKLEPVTAPEKDRQMKGNLVRGTITLAAEITLCPGNRRDFLVGRVTEPNGRFEEGGTGVWVAEGPPPEPEEPTGRK